MRLVIGLLVALLSSRVVASEQVAGFSEAPWPGEASFQAYGPEEELMSMGITSLVQDPAGFLWVATDLGLYRFDGHHFVNIGPNQGLPSGPDSRLWSDPHKGVWSGTFAGLYRVTSGSVQPISGQSGLPKGSATSLAWDATDRLWIAMGPLGLFLQSSIGQFEKLPGSGAPFVVVRAPVHGGMVSIQQDGVAQLWKDGALSKTWDAKDGMPTSVVGAVEDGQGRLWILSTHGLWSKSVADAAFLPFVHSALAAGGDYRDIKADGQGGLWIATVRGLFHIRGKSWTYVTNYEGMPTRSAAQVLVDREGSLWYASNGLYRQLGLGAWYNQTTRQGLPTEIVWAVSRDATGRLWAGTNLGLAVQEGGSWKLVPGSEKSAILSMVALSNGGLVAAGRPRALLYVAPGATSAVPIPTPFKDEPASIQVDRVFKDNDGNAWVMGSHQIVQLVPKAETLEPGEMLQAPDPGYFNNAYASMQDKEGRFWFAGRNGLGEYSQGKWRLWKKEDGLLEDSLYGLNGAPDGTLLVSYYSSLGVSRLRVEGDHLEIVRNYRVEKGDLPTNSVFSIHRDLQDRTWLLTDVGVVLLKEDGFYSFGKPFGLLSQDMVFTSFLAERDGTLWFGDASSLGRFDSAAFPWSLPIPTPVFQEVRFGSQSVALPTGAPLEIQPKDNALETSLSFLSYARAKAFTYEVRIDGLDTAWRKETSPVLHYLSLPSGSYTLRARAIVNGRPGPEAELPFQILPRWTQTWPVRLAALALMLIAIWGIITWRQRSLRLANLRLEAEVARRTQELGTANARLAESSVTDPLTSLYNRRYLSIALPEQLAAIGRTLRFARREQPSLSLEFHPLVFLLLDIDHFKLVNDEYGHDAGDAVLVQVGTILKTILRDSDSIVRWGGEEFLVVARSIGACDPATLAERIRSAIEAHNFLLPDGRQIHKTVSIGFCAFPLGFDLPMISWETAVLFADRSLFVVKRNGRNAWLGLYEGASFKRALLDAPGGRLDIAELLAKRVLDALGSRESVSPELWK